MDDTLKARFDRLRGESAGAAEWDALWTDLPTVSAEELLGSWSGFALSLQHRTAAALEVNHWHGKRFDALDDAQPMVCRREDGELFDDPSYGAASLWNVEFRGETTATMIYDNARILDHFKRVDDHTLLGIMNGKSELVLDDGEHFYFGLVSE